ncbi:TPA: helix-turn-helix transcriptional regulator [Candidatus Spyradomonas excrementavium]|nr:helix-turn-helix transcriptional regulator [Candidatus Spyradomonas excrementavium]
MDKKKLSIKLKNARIEAGLKQEDIAKLMNLPISAISVIENGKRGVDVIELLRFAEFYHKPVDWFFNSGQNPDRRRWYDKDSQLREAVELLRIAPARYQKSCACAIIGFLKDSGLVK